MLRTIPPVLRARDFHLYTEKGRLTDLWQCGGAAVLGHTPPSVLRELKNAANRRLFVPFPHPQEKRLLKALFLIFPGRSFRVYGPGTSLAWVLNAAGLGDCATSDASVAIDDPAAETSGAAISLWRPFVKVNAPLEMKADAPPVLIPVLPAVPEQFRESADPGAFPAEPRWPCGLGVMALDPDFEKAHPFPPSDLVSPALLAVVTRGIYDLVAATERGRLPFPKVRKALAEDTADDPGRPWRRRGIYASFGVEGAARDAAYPALFTRFLEAGFLLPPDPRQPLILPGTLSPGEEAALAGLLKA